MNNVPVQNIVSSSDISLSLDIEKHWPILSRSLQFDKMLDENTVILTSLFVFQC